jgi:hypothetical protein
MPGDTGDPTAIISQMTEDIAGIIRREAKTAEVAGDGLAQVIRRLAAVHEGHLAELLGEAGVMGGRPEDRGAMTSTVRAVPDIADEPGQSPHTDMGRVVSGEEWLLSRYDASIAAAGSHSEIRNLLRRQRAALEDYVATLRGG